MKPLIVSLVTGVISSAGVSHAATLSLIAQRNDQGTVTLPSSTGSGWAYYNVPSAGPLVGTPTNTSTTHAPVITLSPLGPAAASFLGSGTASSNTFLTFSNGVSPTSGSGTTTSGIRNNLVGSAAVNNGLRMTLGALSQPSTITLWTYQFIATATLTVYSYDPANPGTTTQLYTQTIASNNGKEGLEFSFNYTPTGSQDALRFDYTMTAGPNTASNIGFIGLSAVPIPEPAAASLCLLALTAAGCRRRH